MKFNHLDSMLLQCICNMGQEDAPASLRAIMAYWDFIDRSVPDFGDLLDPLEKLSGVGIIHRNDLGWFPEPEFFLARARFYKGREWIRNELEREWISWYLDATYYGELEVFRSKAERPIQPNDYEQAYTAYIGQMAERF